MDRIVVDDAMQREDQAAAPITRRDRAAEPGQVGADANAGLEKRARSHLALSRSSTPNLAFADRRASILSRLRVIPRRFPIGNLYESADGGHVPDAGGSAHCESRLCTCTIKAVPNSGVARLTIGTMTKAAM